MNQYPNDPTTGSNQPYPQVPPYPPQGYPAQQYMPPPPGYQPMPGYPPVQSLPAQQQPVKKKGKLGLIIGIIAGSVVLCSLIGCGIIAAIASSSKNNVETITKLTSASNTGSTNSTSAINQQPAQSTQHFKPGDTVTVGGTWQIVVSNVRTDAGGQFDSLKTGDTYLAIDMSFKNISSREAQLFGTADWTLKDTSGQNYESSYDSNITATGPDGKIEPGDPAKGTIVWEVPSSMKHFTLAYNQNLFESGQTIWDITLS